jgi:hypothetical protein
MKAYLADNQQVSTLFANDALAAPKKIEVVESILIA